MFGILNWLQIGVGAVAGAALMAAPVYYVGKSAGTAAARVASLEKSVEVLRERNAIDEEVSASDAPALCRSYGLPENDIAECVRRLGSAPANGGDRR